MGLFQSIDPDGETPTADIFDDGLGDYSQDEYVKGLDSSCSLMVTLHLGKMSRVKKLAEMDARELQVGVQFVQIGDDGKATQFLKELDNNIQEEYGLDRGVSKAANKCADFDPNAVTDGGHGIMD